MASWPPKALDPSASTSQTLHSASQIPYKPLLLRPTSPPPDPATSNALDARTTRRIVRLRKVERTRRRMRPQPLSARERRLLEAGGDLIGDEMKGPERYEMMVGLWRLWVGYMWEILGLGDARKERGKEAQPTTTKTQDASKATLQADAKSSVALGAQASRDPLKSITNTLTPPLARVITAATAGPLLASADLHGADVEVVRSRCVGRVGCRGIVVRDTKFTLVVVMKRGNLRTIPKGNTIFRVRIPLPQGDHAGFNDVAGVPPDRAADGDGSCLVFEFHGSQLEVRPTDRATKKFKPRRMDHL